MWSRGMLGCCIAVLSLMGTVLAGFALAVDETTTTGTEYQYVTDISGLFDHSDVPQFVEYNPAANWTGYYTAGSSPTSGINYTASARANSYPVQQEATKLTTTTLDLTSMGLPAADPPGSVQTAGVDIVIVTDDPVRASEQTNYVSWPRVATLSDILSSYTFSGYSRLVIDVSGLIAAPSGAWTPTEVRTNPGGSWANYATYVILPMKWQSVATLEVSVDKTVVFRDSAGAVMYRGSTATTTLCFNQEATETGFPKTTSAGSGKDLGTTMPVETWNDPKTVYMDISAGVSQTAGDTSTFWSNGYENSRIDILFRNSSQYGATWTGKFYFHEVGSSETEYFSVSIDFLRGGGASARYSDLDIGGTATNLNNLGSWKTMLVSVDLAEFTVTFTPVANFVSFQEYRVVDSPRTVEMAKVKEIAGDAVVAVKNMEILSSTTDTMTFGVVRTDAFMDTYGSVMTDPVVNIRGWFPDLTDYRVNFYSFALTGSSITINGVRMPVSDGMITLPDGSSYNLQDLEVTYPADGHVYLVLRDETMLDVDLGEKTTEQIAMTGNWYFTTALYEGVQKEEKDYEWTWTDFVFGEGAAIAFFFGLLVLGTVIGVRYAGMKALDMLVVVGAAIIGLVILS